MNAFHSIIFYILLSSLSIISCNAMNESEETGTTSSHEQSLLYATLQKELLHTLQACIRVNSKLFDFKPHEKDQYIFRLQRIASYFSFQQRLMIKILNMINKSVAVLLQINAIKKRINTPPPSPTPENINAEQTLKAFLLCHYIKSKLSKIKNPDCGPLSHYDFITILHEHETNYFNVINKKASQLTVVKQGIATYKTIEQILESYFLASNQFALDRQYQEIIRALRLAIHSSTRLAKNRDYSIFILDPYYPALENIRIELLDSLLFDRERENYLAIIKMAANEVPTLEPIPAENNASQQSKQSKNQKQSKKKREKSKHKNMQKQPQKTVSQLPIHYKLTNTIVEGKDLSVTITDPDNELSIELDLTTGNEHNAKQSDTILSEYYAPQLNELFANANPKIKHTKKQKYSKKRIQQNRFSPLADLYIEAIGRKYLELKNPHATSKMTLITTICLDKIICNDQQKLVNLSEPPQENQHKLFDFLCIDQELLAKWLWHANKYKLEPRIRIDMDAKITNTKTSKTRPGLLQYIVDPLIGQIIKRTMTFDS